MGEFGKQGFGVKKIARSGVEACQSTKCIMCERSDAWCNNAFSKLSQVDGKTVSQIR
jgi:hypothetical protein